MRLDFSTFLKYISVSPDQFIVCAASIGIGLVLTWKQITEHRTNWIEISAQLSEVKVDHVTNTYYSVNADFNYAVNGSIYHAFSQESFGQKELADERARLIKEFKSTTILFYDEQSPKQAIFSLNEVQTSWPQFGMLIGTAMVALIWSLWMIRARYDYLG